MVVMILTTMMMVMLVGIIITELTNDLASGAYDQTEELQFATRWSYIYATVVKPVVMYCSETWALRKREEQQLDRTELWTLSWIFWISLRDRRRNNDSAIWGKIEETTMWWCRYIMRGDDPVKVAYRRPQNIWDTKDEMEGWHVGTKAKIKECSGQSVEEDLIKLVQKRQ